MVRSNPLISVIIPAYNHGQFIEEALESVFAQTYKNLEVIVVDDGSTDDTRRLLEKYHKEIIYIYQKNAGVSSARNRGISVAKGEVIAFLDSDDVWLPEKLESQLRVMQEEHSTGLVGCGWHDIDYSGKPTRIWNQKNYSRHEDFVKELLIRNTFPGGSSGALVKRECFEKVGLFDESLRFGEDWDMWIRISKVYGAKFVEKPLVKLRSYDSAKAYKNIKTMESNIRMVINKNVEFHKKVIRRKANSWMYTDMAMYCLSEKRKLKAACFLMNAICSYPFKIYQEDRKIRLLFRSLIPNIAYRGIKAITG